MSNKTSDQAKLKASKKMVSLYPDHLRIVQLSNDEKGINPFSTGLQSILIDYARLKWGEGWREKVTPVSQ